MKSKHIVCDVDGVLVEFNRPSCELLISLGANLKPLPPGGPTEWYYHQSLGATKDQIRQMWAYINRTPKWWYDLPPHRDFHDDARMRLWDACQAHDVSFVTSRPAGTRSWTTSWLQFYLPAVQPQVLVTPHHKTLALIAMEPDVIIEDKLQTLQECRGKVKAELILIDRPYNQGDREGITVVGSTFDALELTMKERHAHI